MSPHFLDEGPDGPSFSFDSVNNTARPRYHKPPAIRLLGPRLIITSSRINVIARGETREVGLRERGRTEIVADKKSRWLVGESGNDERGKNDANVAYSGSQVSPEHTRDR